MTRFSNSSSYASGQKILTEGEGGVWVWVRGVSEVKQYPSGSGQKSTTKAIKINFSINIPCIL